MKSINLILLFTILSSLVFCQNNRSNVDDHLIELSRTILDINQSLCSEIVSLRGEEFLDSSFLKQPSAGYGMLYAYFVDGELVKIKEVIGILAFREMAITDYYFQSGKLIFVFEKERLGPYIFFNQNENLDYFMTTADFKARYYFEDSKIIDRSETGTRQSILLPNEEYFDSQSKEGQLLDIADEYYKLFMSK